MFSLEEEEEVEVEVGRPTTLRGASPKEKAEEKLRRKIVRIKEILEFKKVVIVLIF